MKARQIQQLRNEGNDDAADEIERLLSIAAQQTADANRWRGFVAHALGQFPESESVDVDVTLVPSGYNGGTWARIELEWKCPQWTDITAADINAAIDKVLARTAKESKPCLCPAEVEIARLRACLATYAECPCCGERVICAADCTFAADCAAPTGYPGELSQMMHVRDVLSNGATS